MNTDINTPSTPLISLLEHGTDGVIILDENKSITFISKSIASMLGYESVDSLNDDLACLFNPGEFKSFELQLSLCYESQLSKESLGEYVFKSIYNDQVWVELSLKYLLNDSQINSVIIAVKNITNNKLIQKELLHANKLYAFISQVNQAIVRIQDEEVLFQEACRIAVEFGDFKMAWIGIPEVGTRNISLIASHGATKDELKLFGNYTYDTGGPIENVINGQNYRVIEDINKENSEAWERIASKQKYNSAMVLAIKKFGQLVAILSIYSPETGFFNTNEVKLLREATADICFALEILEDKKNRKISDEKRELAEVALLESNKRYELISRATSDAIWDWDLIKETLYVAEGFEILFGYESREVPVSDCLWSANVHPDEQQSVIDSLDQVVASNELIWQAQYRFKKSNGQFATVKDTGYVIRDQQGRAVRMVGAMRDITAAIEGERTLAELNKNLQAYTNELVSTNTGLQQFSYIISHNLRSPVANIVALTEYLRDETNTPETNLELQEALSTSVNLLNGVIEDLTSILAVKNKVSDKMEEISLRGLLSDIQVSIQNLINDSQAIINVEITGDDTIYSLKSYLHSVFINLISNSIKYAQTDKNPIIQISIDAKGDFYHITFRDNGMGIDLEKKKDEVFGLYKRFHENIRGKGMGLFMVKTQLETLGGTISIQSEVNVGTEFKILLPIDI
ncbi:MAG: PAS domain S-box protein [Pedobacter sp.]|nr:PAS domain S-box protein [Pedobacter sp.]